MRLNFFKVNIIQHHVGTINERDQRKRFSFKILSDIKKEECMNIIATHINYYFVCKRKLWLFCNGITMEHTSEAVSEGKLIHETVYPQRAERYQELEVAGCKIDFYDAIDKVVHEIKKSNKVEYAHEWQVKYYIYILENQGVFGVTGILEYPKMKQKTVVHLSDSDRVRIREIEAEIVAIVESTSCPPTIYKPICKKCSYYDFCYVAEVEE